MNADDFTAQWEADEARIRQRLHAFEEPPDESVFARSGMEILDAIFAGKLSAAPIGDTLDITPISIEPGTAIFQGRPHRRHYNPQGIVHGGWFATLLDSAVGCAVHSTLPAG